MTAWMVVAVGVGGQPALRTEVTTVPRFVETVDPHGVGLRQFLDSVALGVIEVAREIGLGQRRQVAHTIDEEHRVGST